MNTPQSNKERIWFREYLKCWNATEAARRADYKWPNKIGPKKKQKFDELIQQNIEKKVMESEEVLRRLSEIARGEYAYYITEQGEIDIKRMIEEGKAHLITGIHETQWGKRVKFADMQKALEKVGEAHGIFKDVHELTGPDGQQLKIHVTLDD